MIYIDLNSIKPNPRAGAMVSHVLRNYIINMDLLCIPEWFTEYDFIVVGISQRVISIESIDERLVEMINNRDKFDLGFILYYQVEAKYDEHRHNPLPSHKFKYQHHKMHDGDYPDCRQFETLEHALKRLEKRKCKNGS